MRRRIKLTWDAFAKLLTDSEMLIGQTTLETAERIENITLEKPHTIIIDLIRYDKRKGVI